MGQKLRFASTGQPFLRDEMRQRCRFVLKKVGKRLLQTNESLASGFSEKGLWESY